MRTLLALPLLLLSMVVGLFLTISRVLATRQVPWLLRSDIVPLLLALVTVVSLSRSYLAGQLEGTSLVMQATLWIGWVLLILELRRDDRFIQHLINSVVAFVAFNALLAILRVPAAGNPYAEAGPATVIGVFGISLPRYLFPLALGINGFGIIAGLALIISAQRLAHRARSMGLWLGLLVVASICLLLTDSRGSMAAVAATLVVAWLLHRRPYWLGPGRLAVAACAVYVLGTASILLAMSQVQAALQSAGLERGGTPLSGRGLIWASGFVRMATATPRELLWGFGHLGQATSGASEGYVALFNYLDMAHPEQVNLHSSFLQQLLDGGLVGISVLLGTLARIVYRAGRVQPLSADMSIATTFILYGVAVGMLDLTFNSANPMFFMLLLGLSFGVNWHTRAPGASHV